MRYIFDTQALIALFSAENGAERVDELVNEVEDGLSEGFISVITLTEIFYAYSRKSADLANERINQIRNSKLVSLPVDQSIALTAGAYKTKAIPIADALIAASAYGINAKLVTDDSHFKDLGIGILRFR